MFRPIFRGLVNPAQNVYLQALAGYGKLKFFPLESEEPMTDLERYLIEWRTWKEWGGKK